MNGLVDPIDEVTYCSLATLSKQKAQARLLKRGGKNIHARQSGQHLSVHKGRGMDFTESRLYQSGDDVRLLDWRVTARTGKPHTKVFSEERERPVMLIVDLRQSMFFGTRSCYKSVLAAKIAGLLVWKSLQDGDKSGGMVISNTVPPTIHKSSRSQSIASQFLNTIAKATESETAHVAQVAQIKEPLADSLQSMRSIIETGSQLIMLSDFRGLDAPAVHQLIALANKSSLTLVQISDPFEERIMQTSLTGLRLTDGNKDVQLSAEGQQAYRRSQQARNILLEDMSKHENIHLIALSTANTSTEIMLALSRGFR